MPKPELLDTYEAERRPVAEQVIWAASSLHDIFMTHGKDIAQRTETMFEPGYTEKVVNALLRRGLHISRRHCQTRQR